MGDYIVLSIVVLIIALIIRYILNERKKAKVSCYGIACIGCSKASQCSSVSPEELLENLRKEIRQ